MFTAVLFIIAKNKEKPKCPPTIKWMDYGTHLHNRTL